MASPALTTRQKVTLGVLALTFVAFVTPSVVYGLRAAWTDASTAAARRIVNGWRDGFGPGFSVALHKETVATLEQGIQGDPDNAQVRTDLAFIHMAQAIVLEPFATNGSPLEAYRLELIDKAIAQYRQIVQIRPRFPYGWGYLAIAKSQRGQHDAEMWDAFDKALNFGHNEGGVQLAIAEVAFAHWKTLEPSRKERVLVMLQRPNAEVKKDILKLAEKASVVLP
jgi:tetratricopeptide (TPR) repeat protein